MHVACILKQEGNMKTKILTLFACTMLSATSANAVPIIYQADLTGSQEVGPNGSTATGHAIVTIDTDTDSLRVQLSFAGLTGGNATAAHIHCCSGPGVNSTVAVGFPGFPSATSGAFDQTFNLGSSATYNATFFNNAGGGSAAGAEAALAAGLAAGKAYVNIHNAEFPGGEIRGDLPAVPAPASLALLGVGLTTLVAVRRRRAA